MLGFLLQSYLSDIRPLKKYLKKGIWALGNHLSSYTFGSHLEATEVSTHLDNKKNQALSRLGDLDI